MQCRGCGFDPWSGNSGPTGPQLGEPCATVETQQSTLLPPCIERPRLCQSGHIRCLGLSPALRPGLVDPVGCYFRLRGQHGMWSHLSPQTAAGLLVFLATKEVRVWMDEHSLLLTPHRWDSMWFHSIHGNGVPSSAPPVHPIPFQLSPSTSIPSICFATFISLIRYKTLFHQLSSPAPMGGPNIH